MKIKINIINKRCVAMSEAVTIPRFMMMTSTVSKESFARDTDRQTDSLVYLKLFQNFEKKKERKNINEIAPKKKSAE